jgi:hypothetical protein
MEGLYLYGDGLRLPDEAPVGSWERAARLAHEIFLLDYGRDDGHPTQRPWGELSTFHKESNVRLITATLASAVRAGRAWGPRRDASEPFDDVAEHELDVMARWEHESWLEHHVANGWKRGVVRDDTRRRHPLLLPWEALDDAARAKSRESIATALRLLSTLGYRSHRPSRRTLPEAAGGAAMESDQWQLYKRQGEVTARRLLSPWTWTTESGEVMCARSGDWEVRDKTGRVWSVADPIFSRTYEQLEDGVWRRTGVVRARPGRPGEAVTSLEGRGRVHDGDWVVQGDSGELWIVPHESFELSYTRVLSASGDGD